MSYCGELVDFVIWQREIATKYAEGRRGHAIWVEECLVKEAPIERQGAKHYRIHEHPPYQRRRGTFVEAEHAFFADGEEEALEGARESRLVGGLESDFDCIERVTDCGIVNITKL